MSDEAELPDWVRAIPIDAPLYLVESYHFLHVLKVVGGNRTMAARCLEISLRTVRNKVRQLTAMGFTVPPSVWGKPPMDESSAPAFD
jgi:hypothetical protein